MIKAVAALLCFAWSVVLAAAEVSADAAATHWAFQPIQSPKPPGKSGPRSDPSSAIDAFIRARLREHQLDLSPPADRATLLRRATFDLVGLPPSPEELAAFLADRSRDAYPKVIDRLLASRHYGERWARWWLDLARYADTNGQDENKAMANAWRYRDWVIRSFRENLPIDQFIQLQLAGDLLPAENAARETVFNRWMATGFLVLGPKMLAEQDKPKLAIDIVDEQIETAGRAFLGLTVHCARCHDHKFDPISTRDYYALAGIFKSTRTMENFEFVSKFNERWLAPASEVTRWEEHRKKLDAARKELDAFVKTANEALGKPLPEKPRTKYPPATLDRIQALEALRDALTYALPPEPPRALAVEDSSITNLPVHIRGSHLNLAAQPVPRGFISCLEKGAAPPRIPDSSSGRLEFAQWITHPRHPLTARVMVNRVWQSHFGEGLVRTPDNFGLRGEPPSHPELLDWLAADFTRSGWDLKRLHRAILLSKTYRQRSDTISGAGTDRVDVEARSKTHALDPENRWLSYFPRRRVEAEMLRDALLAVSGTLDRSEGGTLVDWKNNDYAPKEEVAATSKRRSIYLPVVRDRLYDLFTIFDFANPSVGAAKRVPTVVSHQALFFLNSPLVVECAQRLAAQVATAPDDRRRVDQVYLRVLGRKATAPEVDRALRFLNGIRANPPAQVPYEGDADPGLAAFCQTLFASSEFLYLD